MKRIPLEGIAWSLAPPKRRKVQAKIVRARPAEPVDVVIHSAQVLGVITHWVNGRTKPCLKDRCPCRTTPDRYRPIWKGYVLATNHHQAGKLVIVEITQEAAQAEPRLSGGCEILRGARLQLRRRTASPASDVLPTLTVAYRPDWPPEPFPLLEALGIVWFGVKQYERELAAQWFAHLDSPGPVAGDQEQDDGGKDTA